ncbi:hypothetical protein CPR19088_GLDEOEPO_00805 [Companilactobacillus paralimentarius]
MNKEAIKQAATQLFNSDDVQNSLDELKFGNHYETAISIFDRGHLNLDISVIRKIIEYLNQEHPEYIFKLERGFSSPKLYIADKGTKVQNKETHATKTMRDLEEALNKVGIHTDLLYHIDPDMLISDDEFEKDLNMYTKVLK